MNLASVFLKNNVFLYMSTRYVTYFIQFLTSLIMAAKLGPDNLGVWGFYLVLLNYITFINLGLPNSLSVTLVQQKDNNESSQQATNNCLFIWLVLSAFFLAIGVIYYNYESSHYVNLKLGYKIFVIITMGILNQLNAIYASVYRVKNRLFEMAFNQSAVPLLLFVACFLGEGSILLEILLWTYLVGEIVALLIYIARGQVKVTLNFSSNGMRYILKKGLFLFVYNTGFYFILLSVRTAISTNYSLIEFGYFTFAYTIANALLLLLQSFNVIIFPKLIDKFATGENNDVHNVSNILMNTTVTLSYLLVFIAIPLFPILLLFLPQYSDSYYSICLTALSVLLYTNAVYGNYLMAKNKEKILAVISIISLVSCYLMSFILINIINVSYGFVVTSILFAYFIYSYLVTYFSKKELQEKTTPFVVIKEFFPIRLLIPYVLQVILVILRTPILYMAIAPVLFVMLNTKQLKDIIFTIKLIIKKPQIINLNRK